MNFIFFPESMFEKLLKSKILEIQSHLLIFNSISKFVTKGKKLSKKLSLHSNFLERERESFFESF
jgi:hypothetical protein